jgi:hypothetical protein
VEGSGGAADELLAEFVARNIVPAQVAPNLKTKPKQKLKPMRKPGKTRRALGRSELESYVKSLRAVGELRGRGSSRGALAVYFLPFSLLVVR